MVTEIVLMAMAMRLRPLFSSFFGLLTHVSYVTFKSRRRTMYKFVSPQVTKI